MATVNLPVDDGSILTLVGVATDERPDHDEQAPILGPVSDFLQQFLIDGALVGVIGNASYDLLKPSAASYRSAASCPALPNLASATSAPASPTRSPTPDTPTPPTPTSPSTPTKAGTCTAPPARPPSPHAPTPTGRSFTSASVEGSTLI